MANQKWGALAPKGLPSSVVYCRSCVISNQRPITKLETRHSVNDVKSTTNFTDGICDACRWATMKNTINWDDRNEDLLRLCDTHRSSTGNYDVIVPASGGKDSRYVAHILKTKYGMNPLTVTWRPHLYTRIGFENLTSMIDAGFDNVLISPNGAVQRKLCKLAFERLGHPFQPFIIGQRAVGPKIAKEYGVKLVFYGENVAEYGNRIEDNFSPLMDRSLYTAFDFNSETGAKYMIAGIPLNELACSDNNITWHDLKPYKSLSKDEAIASGIEVHYMSYYRKWVPQENYYYAVEHTNFQPNPKRRDGSFTRYSGIDDKMEDLHYYMQLIKFGMGRCTWDTAQEIRTGLLEREEAVSLVKMYDFEAPTEYFDDILEYLDITEEQFWTAVGNFRSPHLWDCDKQKDFSLKYAPG